MSLRIVGFILAGLAGLAASSVSVHAAEAAWRPGLRLVQGQFASPDDRQALERALAKGFLVGPEQKLSHPLEGSDAGAGGDFLGFSVALSGDTALVGAFQAGPNNAGEARVYVRNGMAWSQQAILRANDALADDNFGFSVALSGDTALVGAYRNNSAFGADVGAAYVFTRSAGQWTQRTKLVADDAAAGDQFGVAVSLQGQRALVGAYNAAVAGQAGAGAAYAFIGDQATWMQVDKLTADDAAQGDQFGRAVALSNDTAVIGTAGDDFPGATDAGSAYVFTFAPATFWSQQAKLSAAIPAAAGTFGYAVALDGDRAVVGAYGHNNSAGAAFVYERTGILWSLPVTLTANDATAGAQFGADVIVEGGTVVVGANADTGVRGAAYVFTGAGPTWTQRTKLVAGDGAADDLYGSSVALAGGTLLVGAFGDNTPAGTDAGSAYVYVGSDATWTEQTHLRTVASVATSAVFGWAVAVSGDTAVIGAPNEDLPGLADSGAAYVFTRVGNTWTFAAELAPTDARAANNQYGISVALSGNTALVGAARGDGATADDFGSVYVFTGAGANWVQQTELRPSAPLQAADDFFGIFVALEGDTALIGASGEAFGVGSAYVFTRSGGNWTPLIRLQPPDGVGGDRFGSAVALAGNLALIGAPSALGGGGKAYFSTFAGGVWGVPVRLAADTGGNDSFGYRVALDGTTALIGAYGRDAAGFTDSGAAYVYTGLGGNPVVGPVELKPDVILGGGGQFGASVALRGGNALIGANAEDGKITFSGTAYHFTGAGTTWTQAAKLTASDGTVGAGYGTSVALGADTFWVGAPLDDSPSPDSGSVYAVTALEPLVFRNGFEGF